MYLLRYASLALVALIVLNNCSSVVSMKDIYINIYIKNQEFGLHIADIADIYIYIY